MPYLQKAGNFDAVARKPFNGYFQETKTGTPYIRIPLEVVGGECAGQHIEAKMWINSKNLERSVKRLKEVFGWDGDMAALADGTTRFAGMPCSFESEVELDDSGKPRCHVKWLNAPRGGKALASDKVAAIISKYGAAAKAAASNASDIDDHATEKLANGGQPEPTAGDDDIF